MKSGPKSRAVKAHNPGKRLVLCGAVLFIAVYLIAGAIFMYKRASDQGMFEEITSRDVKGLYKLYVSPTPDIEDSFFYGSPDASISIVVYTSAESESFHVFMRDIFPQLEQEFIKPGKVNLYYKNHITHADIEAENQNFVLAQALSCFGSIKKDKFFDFYMDMAGVSDLSALPTLAEKHGISTGDFLDCMNRAEFEDISTDAAEVEAFGMTGVNPKFYIGIKGKGNRGIDGVPSYTRLRRAIIDRQALIGDLI